jgi:hypothetical protein
MSLMLKKIRIVWAVMPFWSTPVSKQLLPNIYEYVRYLPIPVIRKAWYCWDLGVKPLSITLIFSMQSCKEPGPGTPPSDPFPYIPYQTIC